MFKKIFKSLPPFPLPLPYILDRQRIFSIPREQLEEQCLRLQEENTLLKQHTRAQELKLRR